MRIKQEIELDFDDVLLLPQRTKTASRKDVNLEREFQFYHSPRIWKGIPIMVSNMDTTGCLSIAEKLIPHKIITVLHKFYDIKELVNFYSNRENRNEAINYTWLSLGMKKEDLYKIVDIEHQLYINNIQAPNLVVDIANGYSEDYIQYLAKVREFFPNSIICAGNVCTEEMVPEYILHGLVDIVKVGIGPGSVCTTRIVTGIGRPQLSAINACAYKAHGLKSEEKRLGLVCGDGGCKNSGDVCKAFAGNADFVMLGGMIAGAEECEGDWEYEWKHRDNDKIQWSKNNWDDKGFDSYKTGRKRLKFHGMSSREAMDKYSGGMANYKTAEGKEVYIDNKGPVEDIINDILGGLRSCCSYLGAKSLKEISRCAEFVRVNRTHNQVFS